MKQFLIYCACAVLVALAAMFVANRIAPPTWAKDDQSEVVDEIEVAPEVENIAKAIEKTDLENSEKRV